MLKYSTGAAGDPPSEVPRHAADTTIDQYKVLRLLGRGAMAEVYFARDSVLGRKVALKLIFVGANSPAAAIDSFTQEARVLAQFNHPNILRERPGCYFKLGCALPGVDRPHHSPLFRSR